ncbi:hypothetical protein JTB14_004799 [Gonioctena quinquepunctata]|nr:hypothetical protein JTB14_004799 [Gonioctena quinquepunctata]
MKEKLIVHGDNFHQFCESCADFYVDGGGDGVVVGSERRGGGGGGGGGGVGGGGGAGSRRAPSLRLANGRVAAAQSEEEIRSPPPYCRLAKDDSIKISIENTNTCTDSLVTAIDDETLLITDYLSNDMNYKGSGKVHFDDVSLYGTPKEEPGPTPLGSAEAGKQSFIKNQLQALFQPTDNKLAMKLFGSKKALMKERIRQKAAGHWVIHPCSSFRYYAHIRDQKKFLQFQVLQMLNETDLLSGKDRFQDTAQEIHMPEIRWGKITVK